MSTSPIFIREGFQKRTNPDIFVVLRDWLKAHFNIVWGEQNEVKCNSRLRTCLKNRFQPKGWANHDITRSAKQANPLDSLMQHDTGMARL